MGFSFWATGGQAASIDMSICHGKNCHWSKQGEAPGRPSFILPADMGRVIRVVIGVEMDPAARTIRGRVWKNGQKALDRCFDCAAPESGLVQGEVPGVASVKEFACSPMNAGYIGGENETEATQGYMLEVGNFRFRRSNQFGVK